MVESIRLCLNRLFVGWLFTVCAIHTVSAQDTLPRETELGLIHGVKLDVIDGVTGNCWTNANSIRSKLQLLFERNDIRVLVDDEKLQSMNLEASRSGEPTLAAANVFVNTVGFRSGLTCAVAARFSVRGGLLVHYPRFNEIFFVEVLFFQRGAIYTSGTNTNSQLSDFFEGAASEFVAKIISGRRVLQTYPD